jgi:hypothetical protein
MAVAIDMTWTGMTTEQYDAALDAMGLSAGATHPGALFHWAAKTDDGVRVVDVWETREQFERFAQDSLQPMAQQLGISGEPELTVIEVHNYLVGE